MNKAEIKDWELRTGHLTKDDLLQLAQTSEIRFYENDLPKGPVLDIGTGLGYEAIYFYSKGRSVYAIDKEVYFLNRIRKISGNSIEIMESKMPAGKLPMERFALVILSNILHFLTLKESILTCSKASEQMISGSYALVRVHSQKHPYAKASHKKNGKFKHFFTSKEVKALFPSKNFETVFFSNYERKFSSEEITIMGFDKDSTNKKNGYTMIVCKK